MEQVFANKVALITGGSSGIGRATAMAFAQRGAKVVVASRRAAESTETVGLIEQAGGAAMFVKTDVRHAAEVAALVEATLAAYGRLDFAFNNAGIEGSMMVPLTEYSETTWDDVIDINLKGVFLCMKYQLPHIIAAKGAIVNMSSVAGLIGGKVGAAYYASKHGVIGLTKAAAMEYADQGVRINAVAPAVIETPMAERGFMRDPSIMPQVLARHPMGRIGQAEEVANAVVWLCSDGASFTTGHTLPIDGGLLVP
jgi:NAD(P)-dependent dehydrogenase (short-subunit alcohol dehydrogenase family)